ncbi:hypothetical protein T459_01387 [Capsicum annuum]|uniref:Ubiquitin-like protease family profile domain-containing protein n=1 Tax=Capsicum annuum TaxID=4072 RepID=A0A2G3AGY1_CAPAN|nr:hypothetical protein T459_01387 [Capsicum annuum]
MIIFPQVQSKEDSHVEEVAASKRESHVEKEKFISKKVFDAFREGQQHEDTEVEAQQMDYAGVETSPQQFSPIVDQNLDENQDGTKGCIDLHPDKTNIQIDSQHLIPDELLRSINLDYNLSEKIVHHDDRITDEKLDDTNLSNSQFTIPNELLPSLNAYRRESTTRHSLATLEEEQIDEHFNDKKSESVVQEHCQVDVGTEEQIMTTPKTQDLTIDEKRDETVLPDSQDTIPDDLLPTLNVYSSKSIIVQFSANREIQTPTAKLRIRRPSKFKESPYTMKFGSAAESSEGHIRIFPQKHPFVYHPIDGIVDTKIVNKFRDWIYADLLKVHAKSGHYAAVLAEIEKIAKIISLCLQACDFYVKKGIDHQSHPRYKDKESSDMFDVLFQDDLPQQPSGSLDCGVFMVMYAECLSYCHKVIASEFDPNALRTRYASLLWDYGIRK